MSLRPEQVKRTDKNHIAVIQFLVNDFVKRLDEEVRQARKNREWRHEYMTLRIRDLENLEEGIKIGEEKGRTEGVYT
mgnify:CR=1 FL=1